MADEVYSADASINVSQAVKGLEEIRTALGNAANAGELTDKQVSSLDRTLSRISTTLRGGNSALDANAKSARNAATAYEQLSKAMLAQNARGNLGFDTSPLTKQQITAYGNLKTSISQILQQSKAVAQQEAAAQKESLATMKRQQDNYYNDYLASQRDAEQKSQEISSRSYNNTSVAFDAAIKQREQEGLSFSAQLKARLTQEAAAQEAASKAEADSVKRAESEQRSYIASLSRTRYALYDVSNAAGIFGTALLGGVTLAVGEAVKFQSEFANVQRTAGVTGKAAEDLKQQFIDLSDAIPVSFSDLTSIGTLGGQLGISSNQLKAFTKTVAEFSATTNISVDSSATALGRLAQLIPGASGKFDQLASSILKTGINSVATESQIISIASRIAGIGAQAGLTAPQIIGLSSALASIGVQPYLSSGLITRTFKDIEVAVSDGGKELETFGRVAGQTGQQFAKTWASSPITAFQNLLKGINASGSNAVNVLADLGIKSSQDIPAILKLAQNQDVLTQALNDSASGYKNGATLQAQYAVIANTLGSRLIVLRNNFLSLVQSLGSNASAPLSALVDDLTRFIQVLQGINANPFTRDLAEMALVATTVGGGILLAVSALTRLAGTVAAVQVASAGVDSKFGVIGQALSIITGRAGPAKTSLDRLAASEIAAGSAGEATASGSLVAAGGMDAAAVSSRGLTVALKGLGAATIIGAILQALTELIFNFSGSMQFLAKAYSAYVNSAITASQLFIKAIAWMVGVIPGLGAASNYLHSIADNFDQVRKKVDDLSGSTAFSKWAKSLGDNSKSSVPSLSALEKSAKAVGDTSKVAAPNLSDLGNSASDTGKKAKQAAAQVRTLSDYVNDLQTVMSRSTDIRFGTTEGSDAITAAWQQIADAIKQAKDQEKQYADQIRQDRADLLGLQNTKSQQEYFLSVAQQYGDAKRVQAILAELADTNSQLKSKQDDLTSTQQELNKAQNQASTTLKGNSEQAVANRNSIEDLVNKYASLLQAYADTGASQAQLTKRAQVLKQQFEDQARKLGFSTPQVQKYAQAFNDFAYEVQHVPRNITVKVNANPAKEALAELMAQAQKTAASVSGIGSGSGGGVSVPSVSGGGLGISKSSAAVTPKINLNGVETTLDEGISRLISRANKTLPPVRINGNVTPAGKALKQIQADIDKGVSYVNIDGKKEKAEKVKQDLITEINHSLGTVTLDGNKLPAGRVLSGLIGDVNRSKGTVTIDGNNHSATSVLNQALKAINKSRGYIYIDGNKIPANQALTAAIKAINKGRGTVTIGASEDKASVRKTASNWWTDFTSSINGFFRKLSSNSKKLLEGITPKSSGSAKPYLFASGGFVPGSPPANRGMDNVLGVVNGGGIVGLQGGEPIINNRARGYYGDAMFNAINSLKFPRYGFASGGFVPTAAPAPRNPSAQQVAIDPNQLNALLGALAANHVISVDGKQLTAVANSTNQQLANLGRGK